MTAPALTWYLCDLVTGRIITDLPVTADQVVCNLAQDNTASFNLAVTDDTCPDDWYAQLSAGNRMLVLTINDSPVEAWWLDELPTIGDATVTLTGHTLEACAGTMNLPDLNGSYYDTQAAYLLCTSTASFDGATATFVLPSLADRFGFTVTYTVATGFSDYDYSSTETNNVLAALQALMSQGRIEFRFGISWTDSSHTAFTKTIQINPRIGAYRPDALFDLDASGYGTVASYQRGSGGRIATMVIGTATLTGGETSTTDPQIASDLLVAIASGGPGYPLVELRKTYDDLSTGVDLDAALLARTKATLRRKRTGAQTWTFKLRQNDSPLPDGSLFDGAIQPGVDFDLGDTVPFAIDPRPTDPVGGRGMARMLGYTFNRQDQSWIPTVWPDPDDN